jgi:ADP-ribose pyrophosphatase YjhB (NUDIX family)
VAKDEFRLDLRSRQRRSHRTRWLQDQAGQSLLVLLPGYKAPGFPGGFVRRGYARCSGSLLNRQAIAGNKFRVVFLLHTVYDSDVENKRYCAYCGSLFIPDQPWPRQCSACGQFTYLNPAPVCAVFVPVEDGLLAIRRANQPHRGRLALPAGYINLGEGWRQAGARELFEETGLEIDPAEIQLFEISDAPDGSLIIFGLAAPRRLIDLPDFSPNPEASERVVIHHADELAFHIYAAAAHKYFTQMVGDTARRN